MPKPIVTIESCAICAQAVRVSVTETPASGTFIHGCPLGRLRHDICPFRRKNWSVTIEPLEYSPA